MLHLVITLLVIALIAGLLGFGGIAGTAVGFAKIVFVIALVLFVVSLISGGLRGSFGAGFSGRFKFLSAELGARHKPVLTG
jgi:uncharacterized membrane protein YtjA (UPF0391 family)